MNDLFTCLGLIVAPAVLFALAATGVIQPLY